MPDSSFHHFFESAAGKEVLVNSINTVFKLFQTHKQKIRQLLQNYPVIEIKIFHFFFLIFVSFIQNTANQFNHVIEIKQDYLLDTTAIKPVLRSQPSVSSSETKKKKISIRFKW